VSLDQDELLGVIEKRRKLREFIDEKIIGTYKKRGKPLLIILDEVTFYNGWARAIKNLIDVGKLGPGIGLIATGSYSMDLSSAKRELSGRYGPLGEKLKGEVNFPPRRFIEVAESSLGLTFREFVKRNFGEFGRRTGIIEYLAGIQTKIDDDKYHYERVLEKILRSQYSNLHGVFEGIYMMAGGYPRAVYEALLSARKGQKKVSDARYLDDIYTLLVSDAKKFKLSEDKLKSILSRVGLPSFEISSDYRTLSTLKKEETAEYMEYLTKSGLFDLLPSISPNSIDIQSRMVSPTMGRMKMIVTDPIVFLSIYLCSRGVTTGIFNHVEGVLGERTITEHLCESIVLSHLKFVPNIMISPHKNIGYGVLQEYDRSIPDGLCWYINRKNGLSLIAVEVKCAETKLNMSELEKDALLVKEKFHVKRLIVVTNIEQLELTENCAVIPIEIFLPLL
jgi:predicted AAA+ superfamily ATPase